MGSYKNLCCKVVDHQVRKSSYDVEMAFMKYRYALSRFTST